MVHRPPCSIVFAVALVAAIGCRSRHATSDAALQALPPVSRVADRAANPHGSTHGRVVFETWDLDATHAALKPVAPRPARGFTVVAYRDGGEVARTSTDTNDGSFECTGAADRFVDYARAQRDDGTAAWMAMDPHLDPGLRASDEFDIQRAAPWSWSFEIAAATTDAELTIREMQGAYAASVFDQFGAAARAARRWFGRDGLPVLLWVGNGVMVPRGAYLSHEHAETGGEVFEEALYYNGDRSTFAQTVVGHEAGHWGQDSSARAADEAGDHAGQCEVFPGVAWTEGFATWLGLTVAHSPWYWDYESSDASLTVANYDARETDGESWPRPTPTRGVLQRMSEDEIAAMLWRLSDRGAHPEPILAAVASARMTAPIRRHGVAAFERGYRARDGALDTENCAYSDVSFLGVPAPTFADFLDALTCGGFDRSALDAVTEPATRYPYASDRPRCRL